MSDCVCVVSILLVLIVIPTFFSAEKLILSRDYWQNLVGYNFGSFENNYKLVYSSEVF
jgi:hypothetical protein